MSIIKNDDIIAVTKHNGSILCKDCISSEEWNNLNESQILTTEYAEKEEMLVFCDQCKQKLS